MNFPRQGSALVFGLILSLAVAAPAQSPLPDKTAVSSVSGQFLVSMTGEVPPFRNLNPNNADTNIVQLKPAFLAVAAERFKIAVREQLGVAPTADWSGKVYLRIHPARTLDETVTIASSHFLNRWNYEVDFPDLLSKTRLARAFTGIVLLEMANRRPAADGHSAELPPWLVDGMAQQVLALEGDTVVLSAPVRNDPNVGEREGLAITRLNQAKRGVDTLAHARQLLQSLPVLTFDELSWPTDKQRQGADNGAYFASAQFFQYELLQLKNGKDKLRNMLASLPNYYNWQTAFYQAYSDQFKWPLDVEKWWSLCVVDFAARAPGPRWTTDISIVRLEQLVSVPVEYRNDSNAMPVHAEISLQNAIRSLDPEQRDQVLQLKMRDFALVELRLAPPFGDLADSYRRALADFFGENTQPPPPSVTRKHSLFRNRRASAEITLAKLDALDRARRNAETRSSLPLPANFKFGP